jgi:tetrahydromethanopterin S-methyltransferase subunit E
MAIKQKFLYMCNVCSIVIVGMFLLLLFFLLVNSCLYLIVNIKSEYLFFLFGFIIITVFVMCNFEFETSAVEVMPYENVPQDDNMDIV